MILKGDKVIIKVPITGATSKIRIKRRENNFGNPLSVKTKPFSKADYLEWQISYFLPLDTIWDNFRKAKSLSDKKEIFSQLFYYYKDPKLYEKLKKFVEDNQNAKKSEFKDRIKKIFEDNNETIIIKPHKDNKSYVSYELSDMFKLLFEKGVISKEEIKSIINYNNQDMFDIENQYKIKRETTGKKIKEEFEFFEEKAPLFIYKINDNSFVESILQPDF